VSALHNDAPRNIAERRHVCWLYAVYVQHPIQDQTPQQIAAREDAAAEKIVRRLTVAS
jgi:hypothetical protein